MMKELDVTEFDAVNGGSANSVFDDAVTDVAIGALAGIAFIGTDGIAAFAGPLVLTTIYGDLASH